MIRLCLFTCSASARNRDGKNKILSKEINFTELSARRLFRCSCGRCGGNTFCSCAKRVNYSDSDSEAASRHSSSSPVMRHTDRCGLRNATPRAHHVCPLSEASTTFRAAASRQSCNFYRLPFFMEVAFSSGRKRAPIALPGLLCK